MDVFIFSKYIFLLPLMLVLLIGSAVYLKRTGRSLNRLTRYANVVFLVLILFDLGMLAKKSFDQPKKTTAVPGGFKDCDSCAKPDIYFIIVDEYAGRYELKELFNFDNSPFEKALRQRGFTVVDSSISNYSYTPYSLASIFTMDYLQQIEGRTWSKKDRQVSYEHINRNRVTSFLRSQGYQFRNFSVFQFEDQLPLIQSTFFLAGMDRMTAQTLWSKIDRDIRFNLLTRLGIRSELKSLSDRSVQGVFHLYDETKKEVTRESNAPRLIYTHLMMPHYPYLFDKHGNRTPYEMALEGTETKSKEYLDYLQFANGKCLQLIDHILSKSKKPPIIVFMSDHGFRHFEKPVDKKYYFMNINAVYLPGGNDTSFYKGMSAVNQFRTILNTQFNQELPLLKDSTILME